MFVKVMKLKVLRPPKSIKFRYFSDTEAGAPMPSRPSVLRSDSQSQAAVRRKWRDFRISSAGGVRNHGMAGGTLA